MGSPSIQIEKADNSGGISMKLTPEREKEMKESAVEGVGFRIIDELFDEIEALREELSLKEEEIRRLRVTIAIIE